MARGAFEVLALAGQCDADFNEPVNFLGHSGYLSLTSNSNAKN